GRDRVIAERFGGIFATVHPFFVNASQPVGGGDGSLGEGALKPRRRFRRVGADAPPVEIAGADFVRRHRVTGEGCRAQRLRAESGGQFVAGGGRFCTCRSRCGLDRAGRFLIGG